VEVDVRDLRIVDQEFVSAVERELSTRQRAVAGPVKRARHLLGGLLRCECCGSGYTATGKDYYRYAGYKDRGTCLNGRSVRRDRVEQAVLTML